MQHGIDQTPDLLLRRDPRRPLIDLNRSSSRRHHERPHVPAASQSQRSADAAPLVEATLAEFHYVAVGVAVVTTAVNSLTDWRTVLDAADISRRAPRTTVLQGMLSVASPAIDDDGALALDTQAVIDETVDALMHLHAFLADAEAIGTARAGTLHAAGLAQSWRPLCCSAIGVLASWDTLRIHCALPELYGQNARVLTGLLSGAASGFRPCLDAEGRLYVPELPQKRRWPRRSVLQDCLIITDNDAYAAFVRDASAGGLGLERVAGLQSGDVIAVDLECGRRFHGVIAWSRDGKAGLRFDLPLAENDPLIAA